MKRVKTRRPCALTLEAFDTFATLTTHKGRLIYAKYFMRYNIKKAGIKLSLISSADLDTGCRKLISQWESQR